MASGRAACRDCPNSAWCVPMKYPCVLYTPYDDHLEVRVYPNEQLRWKGRSPPPECPVRLELEAVYAKQKEVRHV